MKVYKIKRKSDLSGWKKDYRINFSDDLEYEAFLRIIQKTHIRQQVEVCIDDEVIKTTGFIDNEADGESFAFIEDDTSDPVMENIFRKLNFTNYLHTTIPQIEYSEYIQALQKTSICNNYIERDLVRRSDGCVYFYNKLPKFKNVFVMGEPGSGKTTALKRIAYDFINNFEEEQDWKLIPIYFKLRTISRKADIGITVQEYINNLFSENVSDEINYLSIKGKVIYLFDGLDELSSEKRIEFADWINLFKKKYPNVRMVITSRPVNSTELFNRFEYFQLVEFTLRQIKELTYRKLYDTKWKSFLSCIQTDGQLMQIVKNPLLLNISYVLYLTNKLIPSNKSTFIRKFINVLIDDWDIHRGIYRYRDKLSSEKVKHYLAKIAYNSKMQDETLFTYAAAAEWLNLEKSEALEIFEQIKEISGLLVDSGNLWEFSHIAFRDFLCANYLVEKTNGITQAGKKFEKDESWEGVWDTAYGLSTDPEFYLSKYVQHNKISDLGAICLCKILKESLRLDKDVLSSMFLLLNDFLTETLKEIDIIQQAKVKDCEIIDLITISFRGEDIEQMQGINRFLIILIETRWSIYFEEVKAFLDKRSDEMHSLSYLYIQEGNLRNHIAYNSLEFYLERESPEVDNIGQSNRSVS